MKWGLAAPALKARAGLSRAEPLSPPSLTPCARQRLGPSGFHPLQDVNGSATTLASQAH